MRGNGEHGTEQLITKIMNSGVKDVFYIVEGAEVEDPDVALPVYVRVYKDKRCIAIYEDDDRYRKGYVRIERVAYRSPQAFLIDHGLSDGDVLRSHGAFLYEVFTDWLINDTDFHIDSEIEESGPEREAFDALDAETQPTGARAAFLRWFAVVFGEIPEATQALADQCIAWVYEGNRDALADAFRALPEPDDE